MKNFSAGTLEDQTQSLADLLPNDPLFFAKNIGESTFRKLLRGLAYEVWRAEKRIEDISVETNLLITRDLISQWESALGIPDNCFDINGQSIDQRRNNVLAKLRARGVATREAFIALALFMGYAIEIFGGGDVAYPPYDVPFFPTSLPQGRFVWYIRGHDIAPFVPPYDVPFDVNIGSAIIPCFFSKLKPANTVLYFINI